ncbi:TlpA family protein disulfide reductase, partial (plasmid) [Humibacter sp. BT305]
MDDRRRGPRAGQHGNILHRPSCAGWCLKARGGTKFSPRVGRARRLLAVLATTFAVSVLLAGCTNDPLADQYRAGDGKGYVAGDGSVVEFSEQERGPAVAFSGTTQDGTVWDSADHLGKVVVVNFWWGACGPCRAEAADLQTISEKFEPDGVQFIGVNTRDQTATITSFENEFGVTYPSIADVASGQVQAAFAGARPLNGTPATLVLDRQGRVSATVLGPINAQPSTLESLISA